MQDITQINEIRQSTLESMTNDELSELQCSLKDYIGTKHFGTAYKIYWAIQDELTRRNGYNDYS